MKSLASRVAALEKRHKTISSLSALGEERFIGRNGMPWVRYNYGDCSIELPCNGRDDPIGSISQRILAGEAMPSDLCDQEREYWELARSVRDKF